MCVEGLRTFMSNTQVFIMLFVIFSLLTGCGRNQSEPEPSEVEKGILDLRQWDFIKNGSVNLNGTWEFYWNQLLEPEDFSNDRIRSEALHYYHLPGTWNGYEWEGKPLPGQGYATFRLHILISPSDSLALHLLDQSTGYRLYANGKLIAENGVVGSSAVNSKPQYLPMVVKVPPVKKELDLVLQVANFYHRTGGPWERIRLGDEEQIRNQQQRGIHLSLFLSGALLIMGLYHLALFSVRQKDRSAFYFGIFSLDIIVRLLVTGDRYMIQLFPEGSYELFSKLEYLSFYLGLPLFTLFVRAVYPHDIHRTAVRILLVLGGLFTAIVLITPTLVYSHTVIAFELITILAGLYAIFIVGRAGLRGRKGAPLFLSGFLIFFATIVNDILHQNRIVTTANLAPLGLFFFIFSQSAMLAQIFAVAFRQVETLSDELENKNRELEDKNKDLEKMDRLKDEFLANTSHELRTPLNGIMGLAEACLSDPGNEKRRTKNLQMIFGSGKRLASLVNDILDFSKLRNSDIQLQIQAVDVRSVAELVLELSRPLSERKGITLILDFPENFPLVEADENRLQQILINLIGNAIKFTNEGSVVIRGMILQAHADTGVGRVRISVLDTGIGIPREKQARIFQSFEQADGTTAREYGGTGLGLSIVKSLVQLHGSHVFVESEVGKGSTFSFDLSVADFNHTGASKEISLEIIHNLTSLRRDDEDELLNSQDDMPDKSLSAKTDIHFENRFHRKPKILVVDDEPVNIQVMENHLETAGALVHIATDGFRALEMVEQIKPDLILLDLMMPRMSGFEVSRRIREHHSPALMPIIILSAKNQVDDLVLALETGANDYLTKPFSSRELIARMDVHLDLQESVREQMRQTRAIQRFVPMNFLKLLGKSNVTEVSPGDSSLRHMSVLFSDIRSFTGISEKMTPEENYLFINDYMNQMEPFIQRNGGFVDKYLGDAIMALFKEEDDGDTGEETSADRALFAALEMRGRLREYNAIRVKEGKEPIEMGIGINTGDMILGAVGSENRLDTTVIGNTVNTASRLEALTSLYKSSILISNTTHKALRKHTKIPMREIGSIVVKGRSEPIGIFEVYALDDEKQQMLKEESKSDFMMGIVMLKAWEFEQARIQFQKVLDRNPEDKVAEIYMKRCEELMKTPPDDEWQGSIDMKEK